MSNKQNDIVGETAFEAHCEDMRMWAVEQEIERLYKAMAKDRLALTAERIRGLAQEKTIEVMNQRLDGIVGAIKCD
jgi:hypothetical protein